MKEIGSLLKERRQQQGYSLEDIHQKTHIQSHYLKAIEDNNFEELPEGVYRRSFIKQYAQAIGFDLKTVEPGLYPEEKEEKKTSAPAKDNDQSNQQADLWERQEKQGKTQSLFDRFSQVFPTILIVLLVLLMIGGFYFAWRHLSDRQQDDDFFGSGVETTQTSPNRQEKSENNENNDTNSASQESESTVELVENDETETRYSLKEAENYDVELTATEDSWIELSSDYEVYYSQTLPAGESIQLTLPGDLAAFYLTIGNSPATEVSINGQTLEFPAIAEELSLQNMIFEIESEEF